MNRRGLKAVLALLSCVVLAAGCANVPEETQPQVITGERPGQVAQDVPQPAKDLDVLTVVRDFVHASAQPTNSNATAKVYLDPAARASWTPDRTVTIIDDTFGTVYAVGDQASPDPNEQIVMLRGFSMGQLRPDSAFIPGKAPYQLALRVHRQLDGQWRIVNPPSTVVVTQSDFNANYFRVPLYFFAPDSSAPVPDLRYVVAKPQSGIAARVVDLLLSGPSDALNGAVRSPLGDQASLETNVMGTPDGAVQVSLTGVAEQSLDTRRLIAAQIVLSLQTVTTSRVRLLSDGAPLVEAHADWRPSDLPAYAAPTSPNSELPGLVTVNGRTRSLGDGEPLPGPAGNGSYDVVSAAQSIDGNQLAIVERAEGRLRLRIGDLGREAQAVDFGGGRLSRPTWRPAASVGGVSGELWTVADGAQVVRVLRTADGQWSPQAVNATDVSSLGQISVLRLSRDGARAAMVVGGQLVVAAVVRSADSVTLRAPRILQAGELAGVVDVDWFSQDTLVAATSSSSLPVAMVPVDGMRLDAFNSANLTPPVRAITAATSRSVVVADSSGLWTASDIGQVWRPHPHSVGGDSVPFYPG